MLGNVVQQGRSRGCMFERKEVGDAANIATWRRGHLTFLTSGL